MESIVKTFKITKTQYVSLNFGLRIKRPANLLLMAIGVVMVVMGFINYTQNENYYPNIAVAIYFFVVYPLTLLITYIRLYNKTPLLAEANDYTINGDAITAEGDGFAYRIEWRRLSKVIETKTYLLVYITTFDYHILPKVNYTSEEMSSIRAIVANHVVSFKLKSIG